MSTSIRVVGDLSYDASKKLGEGSLGTLVFRGFHRNEGAVAVKRVQRYYLKDGLDIPQWEVELMNTARDHPNILQCICTTTNDDYLFIAMELCSGTLDEYFNGIYEGPRFQNEREILRQVTCGLAHLHELNIVHRDIKPANLLIFVPTDEPNKPQMKLADFNISKMLRSDRKRDFTNTSPTNPKGTRGWMAPEVYQSDRFDFKVDVWALGLIFGYTLSWGKHPFGDDPEMRTTRIKQNESMLLTKKDLRAAFHIKDLAFQLIESMLKVEAKDRPTVEDVLNDPFFLKDEVRTAQFLDVCKSFRDSITIDQIFKFKELVMDKTVYVNATTIQNGEEMSPLHLLCYYYEKNNLIELVKDLLFNRADINSRTKYVNKTTGVYAGRTPLHLLLSFYKCDNIINIAKLLVGNGADVNAEDVNGSTPLHCLCLNYQYYNLKDLAHFLIEEGAEVNAKDKYGRTPLHFLCEYYKKGIAMDENDKRNLKSLFFFFKIKGADTNAEDKYTATPVVILRKRGLDV